jgi:hypothetical protein
VAPAPATPAPAAARTVASAPAPAEPARPRPVEALPAPALDNEGATVIEPDPVPDDRELLPAAGWRAPLDRLRPLLARLRGLRPATGALAQRLGPHLPRVRAIARRAAPPTAAALVGLMLGFFLWGRPQPAAPPPLVVAAAPTRGVAAPAPPPAEESPPPVDLAALPSADRAAPAERATPSSCTARIESRPPGALVTLGRRRLGKTPLGQVSVPCGEASVVLSHPRYRPATETLRASPEAPASLSARLARPSAELQLASQPDGAVFKVSGQIVGRGPRRVTVSRFESMRIEASLPGYKSWSQRVYLKGATMKLQANLTKR